MAEEGFQEKTEKATPKKRRKAREEGQVAKSMEIPSVFVLLTGVVIIYLFGGYMFRHLSALMRDFFTFEKPPLVDAQYLLRLAGDLIQRLLYLVVPVFSTVFMAALITNFMQVGFVLSSKTITPKLSNVSPQKGIKRLFSTKALAELIKSILKLTIIFVVAYIVLRGEMESVLSLHSTSIAYILLYILKGTFKLFIWVILAMAVVAAADYAFQRWKFEKDLRMTKQEVKDEAKQTEGDPQIKSRIRTLQYEAARKRMMQEVPDADVVVTNPTHLAVALKYDALSMTAPKVVAKGAGLVAERIRNLARDHAIPVIENKELARNLYKLADIGDEVPSQFFQAVAELLAYVYKLKGKSAG